MKREILFSKAMLPSLEEYYEQLKDIWEIGWLATFGPKQQLFEEQLKLYLETEDVLVFSNGHTALESVVGALRVEGEVITTPFTFISTANSIIRNNLQPVFCDITDNMTIDVSEVERMITKRTVAVVATHVLGNVCDVEQLEKISKRYGIWVIYDGAHVFGVKYCGRSIGNYGDATMFSFHASKVFNSAEGGAVAFNSKILERNAEVFRYFGMKDGNTILPGLNGKMHELTAALGICNLSHINKTIEHRKQIFNIYREKLKGIDGIEFRDDDVRIEYNYIYFYIHVHEDIYGIKAKDLLQILKDSGVHAKKSFPSLICDMDLYRGYKRGKLDKAYSYLENTLVLPLHTELSDDDINYVCDIIRKNKMK